MSATPDNNPSSGVVRGFQWGGDSATLRSGISRDTARGAQFAASTTQQPASRGIRPRGIAYGGGDTPGALFGPLAGPTPDGYGGQWDGPVSESVSSLIDTEGWALVLEERTGARRIAFSPDQPPHRGAKSVGWTAEANAMASWSATVPVSPDLFSLGYPRVIIAHNGERRFHGVLTSVEEQDALGSAELTLSGYDALFWAGHDEIRVEVSDMGPERALEIVWERVRDETDGRVRGSVVRPQPQHIDEHYIPLEGEVWEGTPLSVLKEAHGYAGMAFAADHGAFPTVWTSFVPGEELRTAEWRAKEDGIKPSLSKEGYHNQLTVIGAEKPGVGESSAESPNRYSATVTAPQAEIDRLMSGRIHGRTVRETDLSSKQACRARATTLLAEDRGEWTVGGSLDVTPARAVPGFTYRIDEFDPFAPELFRPVWCTLREIQHSYGVGEAATTLAFEDESGLTSHIRTDLAPEAAPGSLARRDGQLRAAGGMPDRREDRTYAFGDGIFGSGAFGAAATDLGDSN